MLFQSQSPIHVGIIKQLDQKQPLQNARENDYIETSEEFKCFRGY